MKTVKILSAILLSILIAIIGFACGFVINIFVVHKPKNEVLVSGAISFHFLELGNNATGDSIFIQCGENDILIDAGSTAGSSTTIINYVDQFVTDNTLEYVIATHEHEDHIAAFASSSSREGIFEHYKVENIIDFPKYNGNSNVLNGYFSARDEEISAGANHYSALDCYNNENGGKRTYQLSSSVEMEILYNYYYDHYTSDKNNYSVCVMFNQGQNHYLFTGDLEKEGELNLVDYYSKHHGGLPHCVLYKAGHHGSGTSSTLELLQEIQPEYVVICACAGTKEYTKDNDNQFPYQSFVDNIAKFTEKVYVTSVVDDYEKSTVKSANGNIVFTVEGGQIKLTFSNNDLLLKETEWFKAKRVCPEEWK